MKVSRSTDAVGKAGPAKLTFGEMYGITSEISYSMVVGNR